MVNWSASVKWSDRKKRKWCYEEKDGIISQNYRLFSVCLFSDDIRNEIKALKKEYHGGKKEREEKPEKEGKKVEDTTNELVRDFMSEQQKYSNLLKDVPKKGDAR